MADSAFWRDLRTDFETLQDHEFSLTWSSCPPIGVFTGDQSPSQWVWWHFPDHSLRVRFEAIATRGAKALGLDSMDDWLDRIRLGGFVSFQLTGRGHAMRTDGKVIHEESGTIEDLVKHSITLCLKLEADAMNNRLFEHMPPHEFRSMAFWLNLKAQFLSISHQETLSAYYGLAPGSWHLHANLSDDETARRLECAFQHLANRAAITLGIASERDPLEAWPTWLDCLKEAGSHFVRVRATNGDGDPIIEGESGRITHVVLASAEYCDVLATRALKSAMPSEPGTVRGPEQSDDSGRDSERTSIETSRFPNRAAWLSNQLTAKGWSPYTMAQHSGPEPRTTKRVLAGENVRTHVLDSIAAALSLNITDIPRD